MVKGRPAKKGERARQVAALMKQPGATAATIAKTLRISLKAASIAMWRVRRKRVKAPHKGGRVLGPPLRVGSPRAAAQELVQAYYTGKVRHTNGTRVTLKQGLAFIDQEIARSEEKTRFLVRCRTLFAVAAVRS